MRDKTSHIPLFSASSKTQVFYTQTEATVPTPTMTWQNALRKTVEMLKSLVVIRHRDTEITPLVSQTQEEFLRQNLQLILQQAQWAVLQHNQAVYHYSLTQASEWIQHYFADNDQATLALQANINELQKINLTPDLPDINALITQVHHVQLQVNKSRTLSPEKDQATEEEDEGDTTPPPTTTTKLTKVAEPKGDLV